MARKEYEIKICAIVPSNCFSEKRTDYLELNEAVEEVVMSIEDFREESENHFGQMVEKFADYWEFFSDPNGIHVEVGEVAKPSSFMINQYNIVEFVESLKQKNKLVEIDGKKYKLIPVEE